MRNALGWLLFIASATATWAQVGAPVLGYIPDNGRIRPVHGIAASGSAGKALDFGDIFLQIAASPRQDFALVSSASSGAVMLAYPSGTITPVSGTSTYPDRIALSPAGASAVLWFASSRSLEIISGLPSAPAVRQFNASFLSNTSSDLPAAIAVSDDGLWAAGAWSEGKSPGGVWAFGPNGEARNLMAPDRTYALTFFAGRQDLLIATISGIYSVTAVGGSATVANLYTSSSRINPAGIGVSADNKTVIVAAKSGTILTVQTDTGAASQISCDCSPSIAEPLGGMLFRITGITGSVFRIFDAQAGSVDLVPIAPETAAGGSQ